MKRTYGYIQKIVIFPIFTTTEDHSEEDQRLLVKKVKYIGLYVYHRSY